MAEIAYRVELDRRDRHRIGVVLEVDLAALATPEFFLPVWTPGSYLVREYQRHIEAIAAADAESGTPLPCAKVAKNRWRVDGDPRRLRLTYEVYGHELTVRTADFTHDRVYWNGACVFLWPVSRPELRATISLELPTSWRVACQLPQRVAGSAVELAVENHDALVDAPLLAGDLDVRDFEAAGRPHAFVFDGLDGIEPPASLVDDTVAVIEAAAQVFGGSLPYERYEFLCLFADEGRGGLEHTDSSTLLAPRTTFAPRPGYEDFLGLIAHEHFHVWNVKRMRPVELWTFDYERETHTQLLWVAEGFTAYYDDHLCLRAGVLTPERYLEIVGNHIVNLHRTPGRLVHTLAQASYDAWIKLYRPDENSRNSTQSYYTHGALAALCLDLRIRELSDGERSLDDALRGLYRGTWAEGRGYTEVDVIGCLNEAAQADLEPLVREFVHGPFDPDFAACFAPFGLGFDLQHGSTPHLGLQLGGAGLEVLSVLRDGPAARGGVSPGDELLAVEGLRLTAQNWKALLEQLWVPETSLRILLARRGRVLERVVTPSSSFPATCKISRRPDATATQVRLRRGWLAQAED